MQTNCIMKLAFVGKGGSGKSTVSWLAISVLQEMGQKVLAVDADHNMDLTHLLGATNNKNLPTLHHAHDQFLKVVGQETDSKWQEIILDGRTLPSFSLFPKDAFTKSVTAEIAANLSLMAVGLGAEDVLFSSRCAHGHSAPLKFYLPLLKLNEKESVVIDGVAGVDMMNFGLFNGADALVVIVEPHGNSIRVYREITRIAKASNLPYFVIINKSQGGILRDELVSEIGDKLVGELPAEEAVRDYNFTEVSLETKASVKAAFAKIQNNLSEKSGLERLREFEKKRQQAKIGT